jgi:hypothetical protein
MPLQVDWTHNGIGVLLSENALQKPLKTRFFFKNDDPDK